LGELCCKTLLLFGAAADLSIGQLVGVSAEGLYLNKVDLDAWRSATLHR
jgi:hypothetical protein